MNDDLPFLSIRKLAQLVRSKEVSPVEITRRMLDRISAQPPQGNLFLSIEPEEALKAAQEAEKRLMEDEEETPLLGVPIAVADSLRVQHYHSRLGCGAEAVDEEDSIEVERLRKAGGIVIGKTRLGEFDLSDSIPFAVNPSDPSHAVGAPGSAAAVSHGLACCGIATDLWGGVRLSAGECGVVGFKPTRGASPMKRKHVPFSYRHWACRGTLTHSMEDAAILLEVIAKYGFDEDELTDHSQFTIGVSRNLGFSAISHSMEEQLERSCQQLRDLGHKVREVSLTLCDDLLVHYRNVLAADHFAPLLKLVEEGRLEPSERLKEWLDAGDGVTGVQYSLALSYAGWLRRMIDEQLKEVDLLLIPAHCELGSSAVDSLVGRWSMTLPFNMTGHPVLTWPMASGKEEVPVGLQLVGSYYSEQKLLNVGHALQEVNRWEQWRS